MRINARSSTALLAVAFLLQSAFPAFTVRQARADGPADNQSASVRRIPPPGLAIPGADRQQLAHGTAELAAEIQRLRDSSTNQAAIARWLPDVEVMHKAVDWALTFDEFYKTNGPDNEIEVGRNLLLQGLSRARSLRQGRAPWLNATGLVARAYRSRIDGSVQPYGLVVPASWRAGAAHPYRLECWFHGRGETLTELSFIHQRQKNPGEFVPRDTLVLHLYGRYCNANKFAGEIDLLEAIEDVRRDFPIDSNRIVIRGFSMGGAACWQFAVHYPGRWAAAAPGAGFSETPDFLKVFQNETLQPAWYEKKLWHWYDCTDYALNLFHCPTVAYSGEIDKQKQAADMMEAALREEGMQLAHLIGPATGHKYHPATKSAINERIDAIAAQGRDPAPRSIRFTTWTLRYPEAFWIRLEELGVHWERARIEADVLDDNRLSIRTRNIAAFSIQMAPGHCPLDPTRAPLVTIDGKTIASPKPMSDRSWTANFSRSGHAWQMATAPESGLRKRPGLQGPIDDAFMDSFIMVRPTGMDSAPAVQSWVQMELERAIDHWRRQFRGIPRVKNDRDITADDIQNHHLVLWGTPEANSILAKLSSQLPITWNSSQVTAGAAAFDRAHHIPAFVFPNPLNPNRYVVLNSGFTFREYDYLNNARQVPKLPDFAVIDLRVPPSARAAGNIAHAGFFDENWRLPAVQALEPDPRAPRKPGRPSRPSRPKSAGQTQSSFVNRE